MNESVKKALPWLGSAVAGAIIAYLVPFFLSSEQLNVTKLPVLFAELRVDSESSAAKPLSERTVNELARLTEQSEWANTIKAADLENFTDQKEKLKTVDDQVSDVIPTLRPAVETLGDWPTVDFRTMNEAVKFFDILQDNLVAIDGALSGEVRRNEVDMSQFRDVTPQNRQYRFFRISINTDGNYFIEYQTKRIPLLWTRVKDNQFERENLRKVYAQLAVAVADGNAALLQPVLQILRSTQEQLMILERIQSILEDDPGSMVFLKRTRLVVRLLLTNTGGRSAAVVPEARLDIAPLKNAGGNKIEQQEPFYLVATSEEAATNEETDLDRVPVKEAIIVAPGESKLITFVSEAPASYLFKGQDDGKDQSVRKAKLYLVTTRSVLFGEPFDRIELDIDLDRNQKSPFRTLLQ